MVLFGIPVMDITSGKRIKVFIGRIYLPRKWVEVDERFIELPIQGTGQPFGWIPHRGGVFAFGREFNTQTKICNAKYRLMFRLLTQVVTIGLCRIIKQSQLVRVRPCVELQRWIRLATKTSATINGEANKAKSGNLTRRPIAKLSASIAEVSS